ncbi:MAG: glycolate oxidase subunit GlcF [Gammaproteobacteria bacterium]|nr:glycolate oxidase subunit GlcF [Gammaproteobacteria bacterium]
MQTSILKKYLDTPQGEEADAILRACVHCGFCTATCPTYQLLGDELDSPRGRIYLIKQVLEGEPVTRITQRHLDRCLTCRSCETTCPSGVRYGRLLDIGREIVEQKVPRSLGQKMLRWSLRQILPYRKRFGALLKLGQLFRPLLPPTLKQQIPLAVNVQPVEPFSHHRRMLLLIGCVESSATPQTQSAAIRVMARLGVSLIGVSEQGCCGAVSHHLNANEEALVAVRNNIDAWWPEIEAGAEAVVMTASGCGVMVKEYGQLLKHDPHYADKAARVSELARDLTEVVTMEDLTALEIDGKGKKVAIHTPCTLQHGQQLPGAVDAILERLGYRLSPVMDSHLCCGSAGTYSILNPALSDQLGNNKIKALQVAEPDVIVTANVGCQLHLDNRTERPVKHWIELLDQGQKKIL